jgi:hypothetical protein
MFRKLFHTLKSDSPRRLNRLMPRRQPAHARLSIETLEDRVVLSTISVGDATIWEGNAGTTTAAVVVSLSAPARKNVSVNFATTDGTAKAGSDYNAATGKLVFAPGETYKTLLLPVRGDRLGELDEFFSVKLSGARGANFKIGDGQGLVTIADDEPRIAMGSTGVREGDSGTTHFTTSVILSSPSYEWDAYDEAVTVNFATADGTAIAGVDYVANSGSLTFAPGETIKWIDLAICGDRLVEGGENFFVKLSGAPNAVIVDYGSITIADNEPAISILDAVASDTTDEATFTFTIYLSNPYDEPVTVNFATADGTAIAGVDYIATSGTLTFAPGDQFKTITVKVAHYPTDMPDKYFYVRLSDPSANAYFADEWAYGFFYFPDTGGGYSTGDY